MNLHCSIVTLKIENSTKMNYLLSSVLFKDVPLLGGAGKQLKGPQTLRYDFTTKLKANHLPLTKLGLYLQSCIIKKMSLIYT